jgi:PAS domain S-box-containing protein
MTGPDGTADGRVAAPGAAPGPHADRARSHDLWEFAHHAQLTTDRRGVILAANRAAAAILQALREFLPGKPLGLFVAEGHRPRFYDRLGRLSAAGAVEEFETQVGRRGEVRDIVASAFAGEAAGGSPTLLFWVLRDVTELRRAEAARTDLLRRLVTAQEDERRRVSRELHDSFGQLLTGLTLAVRAARDAGPLPPPAAAALDQVGRLADDLARTAHDLAVRLRPTALDDIGLSAALGQLVAEWSARTGVAADFDAAGLGAARLTPDAESAVYRIVQEALTNVARHARASRVSVAVGQSDGQVAVAVEDDGAGFDPAGGAGGRLGLAGMRERAALAGGALEVESAPGSGTTVLARIPLSRPPPHTIGRTLIGSPWMPTMENWTLGAG